MADTDDSQTKKSDNSLLGALIDAAYSIEYKFFAFLLVVFILLSSDTFINRVLSKFDHTLDGKTLTNWGIFIQGLFLTLFMIVIQGAISMDVI